LASGVFGAWKKFLSSGKSKRLVSKSTGMRRMA
jgi:hypothetical protein